MYLPTDNWFLDTEILYYNTPGSSELKKRITYNIHNIPGLVLNQKFKPVNNLLFLKKSIEIDDREYWFFLFGKKKVTFDLYSIYRYSIRSVAYSRQGAMEYFFRNWKLS